MDGGHPPWYPSRATPPWGLDMHRLTALLLCSLLVAFAAVAAPAPVYKGQPPASWVKGWNEPTDSQGGCRFDRDGGRLTLTVPPGKARYHDVREGRRDAPCLLRDVEGDFRVQVRIGGDFGRPGGGPRGAGLMLLAGEDGWLLLRGAGRRNAREPDGHRFLTYCAGPFRGAMSEGSYAVKSPHKNCRLRLERRGDRMAMHVSEDGVGWTARYEQTEGGLPRRMKVGVAAQAGADGGLEAVFDEFELTLLK
jgi:regulation of enolase protein 1 (concanavalin A-like superfamily)